MFSLYPERSGAAAQSKDIASNTGDAQQRERFTDSRS
jgi:hypothetical protein